MVQKQGFKPNSRHQKCQYAECHTRQHTGDDRRCRQVHGYPRCTGRQHPCRGRRFSFLYMHDTRARDPKAVLGVHASFNLACQRCSLIVAAGAKGLYGSGTTSSSLLSVLEEQASMLERDQDVQLNVVGVVGDQGVLLDKEGLDTKRALEYMLGKNLQGWTKPLMVEISGKKCFRL